MTLVECLVACVSLVILLVTMLSLLVSAQGFYQAGYSKATVLANAVAGFSMIERDLHCTRRHWTVAMGSILNFPLFRGPDGEYLTDAEGKPVGDRFVLFYLDGDRVVRSECFEGPFNASLPSGKRARYSNGLGKTVMSGVTSFTVWGGGYIINVAIALESVAPNGRKSTLQLDRDFQVN